MSAYSQASAEVFAVFHDTTPLVEGLSIDEAFLDVSGLQRSQGGPTRIASRLRERIRREVGLPVSIGVASTKFLAKVASAAAKPDGLLAIPLGGEFDFLWPLPVRRIWGVGPATEERLASRGVHTVGELAAVPVDSLRSWLGKASGTQLHALAHNRDPRPVKVDRRRRSVGAQHALGRRSVGRSEADVLLVELVERVAHRLREGRRTARTLELRWRDQQMDSHTMSATLDHPTNDTATLLVGAQKLLEDAWPSIDPTGLGLLGFSVTNLLERQAVQLGFDFTGRDRTELDSTLDAVHERFGDEAITRGSLLGRTPMETPVLPDTAWEP